MADLFHAHLTDRGVIRAAGADATTLLDGLVTNSLGRMDTLGAIHSGLLSPQGKILFDFFMVRDGDDLLIETDRTSVGELIKRLSFYRLRAAVTFTDESELAIAAAWGENGSKLLDVKFPGGMIAYTDPRNAAMGARLILPASRLAELPGQAASEADYHGHRIALGIPEAGQDFVLGDTFPHEALYDQLDSVDFKKGCYIGQEVVSRMQHRGTARKRVVPITGDGPVSAGSEITAGEATIGQVGSTSDNHALALLRLDRANEAGAKGTALMAGSVPVELTKPSWMTLDLATGKAQDDRA